VVGLMGKAQATLDPKGRITLPAKYRKLLPEEVVVAKAPNTDFPALAVYAPEDFEHWSESIIQSKGNKADDSDLYDVVAEIYENAEYVRLDQAGRLLIQPDQCQYAQMDKELMISGHRDHLLVFSATVWQDRMQKRSSTARVFSKPPESQSDPVQPASE